MKIRFRPSWMSQSCRDRPGSAKPLHMGCPAAAGGRRGRIIHGESARSGSAYPGHKVFGSRKYLLFFASIAPKFELIENNIDTIFDHRIKWFTSKLYK